MSISKVFKRLFYFPLGFLNQLHLLGVIGSRDLYNKKRFKNAIIDKGSCFDENTTIKSHAHILTNCIVNNATIDNYTYVGRNSIVQNANIGKFCSIANDVCIGLGTHPTDYFSTSPLFYKKNNTFKIQVINEDLNFKEYEPITIGHDVWIGARAIVMGGVSVGTGAIIAANAVVTKDVPPYAIVGGSPAKIIRYRFDELKISKLLNTEWWTQDLNEIKNSIEELNNLN